jgi:hypothetical protein
MPSALHKPKGHKRLALNKTHIHPGHLPYEPIHRTAGHDAMGGSRAPPS